MVKIFRRYQSTIYGNYRKAYLIDGLLTGVAMSVIMAVRDWLSDVPVGTPDNFISEIVMLLGIAWASYQYRKQLPDQKITLKELMLLGLGIGVVSSIIYGLWTYVNCAVINTDLVAFYQQQRITVMDPAETSAEAKIAIESVMKYGAGDWGFIAGFRSAVMSILFAFLVSLALRTEKSPVIVREKKNN